jgi:hypothetical protein
MSCRLTGLLGGWTLIYKLGILGGLCSIPSTEIMECSVTPFLSNTSIDYSGCSVV